MPVGINAISFTLASIICIQSAFSIPQRTPFSNGTTPSSSFPTPTSTCLAECSVAYPAQTRVGWYELVINTTITAATVVTIVNNRTNITRTSTIYNELPSGYTLPDTNAAGTVVTTLHRSDYIAKTNFSVVLAYPTSFEDYDYFYQWNGVLPTASITGNSTCATASLHSELLPSHPPLSSSSVRFPSGGDSRGLNYRAYLYEIVPAVGGEAMPPVTEIPGFFQTAFADISAFQVCSPYPPVAPLEAWTSASFLTDTSISYEENVQATAGPTEQDTSSSASIVPPTVIAIPTPSTDSGAPPLPPIPVSSSTAQQASTTRLGDTPNANIPIAIPSRTEREIPASAGPSPERLDPAATSVFDESISRSITFQTIIQDSATGGAVIASPAPFTPASLFSEPTGTPLSNQMPAIDIPAITPPTLTIGGTLYTANSATQYEIAPGITVAPGGPPQTLPGTTVSLDLAASYAVINDATLTLAAAPASEPTPAPPILAIGSNTFTANQATEYEIAPGLTVVPGGPARTVSGTTISIAPSAAYVAINGATVSLTAASALETTPAPPLLTIGGSIYTANSATQYEIAPGITVVPGGPAQIVSGTTISLAPSASYLVVNDVTSTLAAPSLTSPVLTIGDSTYTANSASQYIVGGQTLALGSTVTIGSDSSRTVVELQTGTSGSTELIVGIGNSRSTSTIAPVGISDSVPVGTPPPPPLLTLAGQTYTANALGQYSVAPSITLTPGGVVTLSGTEVSLAASESFVVVGSSTITLSAPGMTASTDSSGSVVTYFNGRNVSNSAADNRPIGTDLALGFTSGARDVRSKRSSVMGSIWLVGIGMIIIACLG